MSTNKKKEKRSLPLLLIDIDGTLADWSRRLKVAGPEPLRTADPAAHDAWVEAIQNDESLAADPVVPLMPYFIQRCGAAFQIVYITARTDKHLNVTLKWLAKSGFPMSDLVMRKQDDKRMTWQYKEAAIKDIFERTGQIKAIALDDDPTGELAGMYQSLGVIHLKQMHCIEAAFPEAPKSEKEELTENFLKTLEVS